MGHRKGHLDLFSPQLGQAPGTGGAEGSRAALPGGSSAPEQFLCRGSRAGAWPVRGEGKGDKGNAEQVLEVGRHLKPQRGRNL